MIVKHKEFIVPVKIDKTARGVHNALQAAFAHVSEWSAQNPQHEIIAIQWNRTPPIVPTPAAIVEIAYKEGSMLS